MSEGAPVTTIFVNQVTIGMIKNLIKEREFEPPKRKRRARTDEL